MDFKKNTEIKIRIDTLAYGGRGIGKYNEMVVFVSKSIPGDLVKARIVKKKTNYLEAELCQILEPSPLRIKARCPVFDTCGGCSWQSIPYEKQLVFKEEITRSTLAHIARQDNFRLHSIIPSPNLWGYRNKVEYSFGSKEDGTLVLGFHKPGSYFEIFDVKKCYLLPDAFNAICEEMRHFAREKSLVAYSPLTHEGSLRHFVLRCTTNNPPPQKVLAILITADESLPYTEELVERLRRCCPSLTGFIHGCNASKSDIARTERILYRWGEQSLTEQLEELKIRISDMAFFQTNTLAAERLYGKTRDFLSLTGREHLLDAYCGVGSIGLLCAKQARRVSGIELVREAVWDARYNAAQNDLENCLFLCGEFKKRIALLQQRFPHGFQRIVVDPPRSGLDKKSLRKIMAAKSSLIVYVSCNPATFARDAQVICSEDYRLTDIQPVDMFPHTYHIELVSRFEKR